MSGPHNGRGHHFGRAMHARRWMREDPTDDQIIAMLEEHQRDLEEQVANVADRIRRLREEMAQARAARPDSPPAGRPMGRPASATGRLSR